MKYNFRLFGIGVKIIFSIIILYSGLLPAQVFISGVIMKADSVSAIENVIIKNLNTHYVSISNDSGFYKIKVNNGDLLEFSKTGFATKKIKYAGETIINLTLILSENALDEIVVSASRGDQSLKNTSVSIEIIKPYLIENKNPNTLENTIDQIPGVSTVNGQVVIRGGSGWSYGTGSRVMVMLDGMPMLSGDAGQVQWSFLPLENIENVEVIKGASSVLFGSSALNGVINIKTAKPKLIAETKISTFYGFYGKPQREELEWNNGKLLSTYGIRAFHSQKVGKNSITINLNGFNDDGYRMGDADKRIRLGTQYRRDLSLLNGELGINVNIQSGKSSSFLLWENYNKAYTALDSNITTSQTLRLNIDPYFSVKKNGYKHLLQGRYFKIDNNVVGNVSNISNQSNYSNSWFGEYQVSKTFNSWLNITGGIISNYSISQSPLYQGHQTSSNKATYLQANFKTRKYSFDAGIRYEHYTLNKYKEGKPVIRLGVSHEISKATFLRASFGQGYRFPTIAESYVLTSVGPLKIYPNNQLKSESGWNSEIGLKQGFKIGNIIGLIDVAAFWMEYNRMMEFTFAQWDAQIPPYYGFGFKSLNVSKAQIKGIDISVVGSRKWNSLELKWLGGYTFTNAISKNPDEVFYSDTLGNKPSFKSTSSDTLGNYLKYRPKHLARLDMQLNVNGYEFGVSGRYNSYIQNIDKAFVSFPIANLVPGVQTMREKGKKGDYVFDLRVGKNYKKIKCLLIINNLLNRQYMTRPYDMRPPRSVMLQVNYKI